MPGVQAWEATLCRSDRRILSLPYPSAEITAKAAEISPRSFFIP